MKKIISLLLTAMLIFGTMSAFAFSDIIQTHWAWEYITELSDAGIINGYEDGSFKPAGNVTRAEFAKMLCLALDCHFETQTAYPDIDSHWANEYILRTSGVVYTSSEEYKPDSNATRGEIAYALSMALELAPAKVEDGRFADWAETDAAIADKLASAINAGLIQGYEDNTLRASHHVTRAEAAALIVRAMNYKKEDEPAVPEDEKSENSDSDNPTKDEPQSDPVQPEESGKNDPEFPEDMEHMYTLYPLKDLIIVSDVTSTIDNTGGEEGYRIHYRLAGNNEVYSTFIPDDDKITVAGTKSALSQIRKGDVMIMSTAFRTYIDTLFVVASLNSGAPDINSDAAIPTGSKVGPLGSNKDYEFVYGTVASYDKKTKSINYVLNTPTGETEVSVVRNANVEVYNSRLKNCWLPDSLSAVKEGMFVLIRYTDGVATEVIACEQ